MTRTPHTLLDLLDDAGTNDALRGPGTRLSYLELNREVRWLRGQLRALGADRTTRIVVLSSNGPEAAVGLLAASGTGLCAPVHPRLTNVELDRYLAMLRADLVVAIGDAVGHATDARFPVHPAPGRLLAPAGGDQETDPVSAPDPDDIAMVLPTSGTTSRPKLVALSHRNLVASAVSIVEGLRLGPSDRTLNVMPLFHIHGIVAGLIAGLVAGGSVYCLPAVDLTALPAVLADEGPTWYTAVPTIHRAIVEAAREAVPQWRHTLRFIRSASAPLPADLIGTLESSFGVPVVEAYGMTEASHEIASNPLPPGHRRPGSVGRPTGAEARVVDDHHEVLPARATGHIVIRGPGVSRGYLDDEEATAAAVRNGWLHTGDEGFFDDDGYLHISGRTKEVINRGGEKIYPREVDEALSGHPDVVQAVAFPVPHPRLGEDVAAAVVLRPDAPVTAAELRDHARLSLAAYKVPRLIHTVAELPTTRSGKLSRIAVAAALSNGPTAATSSVGPTTSDGDTLAPIWGAVLRHPTVDPDADFFALGGDSLLGLVLLQRVNAAFGADLDITDLYGPASSVRGMAARLASGTTVEAPELRRLGSAGPMRLAPQQRGLWLLQQGTASAALTTVLGIELHGPLVHAALTAALLDVVERHESLRTRYPADHGRPWLEVWPADEVQLSIVEGVADSIDTDGLGRIAAAVAPRYDPARDSPIHAALVTIDETRHVLLLVLNHIADDAWSRAVLFRDVLECYEARARGTTPSRAPLSVQAPDIADWLCRRRESRRAKSLAYWATALADPPPAPAWLSRGTPGTAGRLVQLRHGVPSDRMRALRDHASTTDQTPFEVALSSCVAAFSSLDPDNDVVVGVPVSLRNRPELIDQVGFYITMVPVRIRAADARAVRHGGPIAAYRTAVRHSDMPLDEIVKVVDRRPGPERGRLFDLVVKYDVEPHLPVPAGPLRAERLDLAISPLQFPVVVDVTGLLRGADPVLVIDYDADRLSATVAQRLADRIVAALAPDTAGTPIGETHPEKESDDIRA